MSDDATLLRRYVLERSEAAFATLVERHLNLVYAAAWRRTGGDDHLAQDIAQAVFIQFARKAAGLTRHPTLVGWLYRATHYAAIDAVRERQRRQRHEQRAAQMNPAEATGAGADGAALRPLLDAALGDLTERDRVAVLLRFIDGRSYEEVGRALGLKGNAARMRVERALERLRTALARRGFTSSSAALAAVLGEQALVAAPAGLAAAITSSAVAATTTATGSTLLLSLLTMNKLTFAGVAAVVVLGTTIAFVRFKSDSPAAASPQPAGTAPTASATAQPGSLNGATALAADLAMRHARVREYHASVAPQAAADANAAKPVVRNRGIATPVEAVETFAWACYTADVEAIARQIHFEGDGRAKAEAVLARLPESAREQWPTPELLYGFLFAADCLNHPPPSDPEIFRQAQFFFVGADRLEVQYPGGPGRVQHYQKSDEAWKLVFPEAAVEGMADQVLRTDPVPTPPAGG